MWSAMVYRVRDWEHPWLRISLLVRAITGTRWDAETWPTAKADQRLHRSRPRSKLLRLALSLGLLIGYLGGCGVPASDVGPVGSAGPRFSVDTEDAYATQCRAGICATLQVTRSRFPHGAVSTMLFFSAYDKRGAPIPIPAFPSGFTNIASEHFVMSPQGTKATLTYSGVSVAWEANNKVRNKTDGQQISADVKGTVGPIVFNPATAPRPGDSGSAFLTLRKAVSRTQK